MDDDNVNQSRKRRRKSNNKPIPAPAFCDATASIVASAFAVSRFQEIQGIYQRYVDKFDGVGNNRASSSNEQAVVLHTRHYDSRGCTTASRHLRRRATSHKRRIRHRFPRQTKCDVDSPDMSTEEKDDPDKNHGKKRTRRARRNNRQWLQAQHETWVKPKECEITSLPKDDSNSTDTTMNSTKVHTAGEATTISEGKTEAETHHWIPTHLWHAKRFRMEALWGWKIPMMHSNRGGKAALRLLRDEKTTVQDITWSMAQPLCVQATNDKQVKAVHAALARVISSFPPDSVVDGGGWVGQGMWHEPDQFPMGALGPVKFMIRQQRPLESNEVTFIYSVWVHPSMQNSARKGLEMIWKDMDKSQADSSSPRLMWCQGAVSCLSLRGKSTKLCLQRAAEALSKDCAFPTDRSAPLVLPQLENSISGTADALQRSTTLDLKIGNGLYSILLWPVAPRNVKYPWNYGVCGFDLLLINSRGGDAHAANRALTQLFVSLVVDGGACPIGLTEQAQIDAECDPPLPVFPRDFPDTPAGMAYWEAGDDASALCSVGQEWRIIRQYYEGGLGRISPPKLTHLFPPILNMQKLIANTSAMDINQENNLVMVRGAFGQPFLDVLNGANVGGRWQKNGKASDRRKTKKRRPSKNPTDHVQLPSPPIDELEQYQSHIRHLLGSLTLPAILLAHVRTEGLGALSSGLPLYEVAGGKELGYVTHGSFSHHRGRSHGTAVVGALPLLQALLQSHDRRCVVAVCHLTNDGHHDYQIRLIVQARSACGKEWWPVSLQLVL